MDIEIGYNLRFNVPAPTPMHLLLHTLPNRYYQPQPEHLCISPNTYAEMFFDAYGNRCSRLLAPAGEVSFVGSGVVQVDGHPDQENWNAEQHPVLKLPYDVLPYLLASRYCEVDQMTEFAWKQFGNGPTGYARARAIVNWVHNHVQFGYGFARSTKTAYHAYSEKQGVCRDFAHLSITLCRCMGIPARYATGYLGDIGIPYNPAPMDFSAWFEVYLGNMWYTLDARHKVPRIGRIVMAYGRDAADTALTTSFGPTTLTHFEVKTVQVR